MGSFSWPPTPEHVVQGTFLEQHDNDVIKSVGPIR